MNKGQIQNMSKDLQGFKVFKQFVEFYKRFKNSDIDVINHMPEAEKLINKIE